MLCLISPSLIDVTYPVEPSLEGSQYGWEIFLYVKYNLRTNYTFIVKKLGISFGSFYKGFDYLLKICTVLLPYYPVGFPKYTQYFFVIRSEYEFLVKDFFGLLPCHTSIIKIGDDLLIYTSVEKGAGLKERFFDLIHRMFELGYIDRFWESNPVYCRRYYSRSRLDCCACMPGCPQRPPRCHLASRSGNLSRHCDDCSC